MTAENPRDGGAGVAGAGASMRPRPMTAENACSPSKPTVS